MNSKDVQIITELAEQPREENVILEWKSNAPYDGCFFRYSYALLAPSGDIKLIVGTKQDNMLGDTLSTALAVVEKDWRFSDFKVFAITTDLYQDIPTGFWPAFWDFFASEWNVPFFWPCAHCGITGREPVHIANDRGNGGIGIEVLDWYCDDCHSDIDEYCENCHAPIHDGDEVITVGYGTMGLDGVEGFNADQVLCLTCGDSLAILEETTITIEVDGGTVIDVRGLPKEITCEIIDHDMEKGE